MLQNDNPTPTTDINICTYTTNRLLIIEWHAISPMQWHREPLEHVVMQILSPAVTQELPPSWQGKYSKERAQAWIKERDAEGSTLLVIEQSTKRPIGLVILHREPNRKTYRLGYLLKESAWGKGFASELIQGLVDWCGRNHITSIMGGVTNDNIASKRVLEKSGFVCAPTNYNTGFMCTLQIPHNPQLDANTAP